MVRRSVLFSPGDQKKLLRKAPESGADVVVFDLEDAVAPGKKGEARNSVTTVLDEIDPDCEVCVRINPLDSGGKEDLSALFAVAPAIDSLMLPKVSEPAAVDELAERIAAAGYELPVLALLETAGGVLDARAIAEAKAVDAVLFGAEDLSADIGATRTRGGAEISYARQKIVLAASNAGIDAIDTLVTDFEATKQLKADTKRAVQFGFDGKMAIHPAQIPIINGGFTPDPSEIDWARRVLDARDEAMAEDRGVFTVDGEMIDAPLITQAERIVERAKAAGEFDETEGSF